MESANDCNIPKEEQKLITVAIAGLPNAGKSTLMNSLIKEKVSIVSSKKQTTRNIIRGIITEGTVQIIFSDLPGIFVPNNKHPLERKIVKSAWLGILDADLILLMIDARYENQEQNKVLIADITRKHDRIILALNKVDKCNKEILIPLAIKLNDGYNFEKTFMISALKKSGTDDLKKYIISQASKQHWLYESDDMTDAPLKFIAAEITREKLFDELRNDLPYSITVGHDKLETFNNGDIKIYQTINIKKASQKLILLQDKGQLLKRVGEKARIEISELTGKRTHIMLFVRMTPNWVDSFNGSIYSTGSEY